MSKLYVSCIVVALLALAVMPAMAAEITIPGPVANGDWANVTVTATMPEYINLDAVDLDIIFVAGEMLDGNTEGYVVAADTAWYTLSTNVPVWVTYDNGSDLALDGTGYKLELQFSSKTAGMIDWTGGHIYGAGGDTYSIWRGCGDDDANAVLALPPGLPKDIDTFGLAGCQTLTLTTRARLYQAGLLRDPGGDYTQVADELLTLTFYNNQALAP